MTEGHHLSSLTTSLHSYCNTVLKFIYSIHLYNMYVFIWAFLVAQLVKNLHAVQETWVRSMGWEDPLEKGKATHSSILAWRIPWTVSSWDHKLDTTEQLHYVYIYICIYMYMFIYIYMYIYI